MTVNSVDMYLLFVIVHMYQLHVYTDCNLWYAMTVCMFDI